MVPRSESATTEIAPGSPEAVRLVPSMGSMATSTSGSRPLPISSPKYSIGASSFSPSPMTIVPRMSTSANAARIASTARASAAILLPRPCSGAAASAPASVTRSSSSARLRLIPPLTSDTFSRLPDASSTDRQLVGLDPQVLLADEAALAFLAEVDAGSLQDGRDPHRHAVQLCVKSLDEELVLFQLDFAQAPHAAWLRPRRQLDGAAPARRALDCQARRGRRAGGRPARGGRRRAATRLHCLLRQAPTS